MEKTHLTSQFFFFLFNKGEKQKAETEISAFALCEKQFLFSKMGVKKKRKVLACVFNKSWFQSPNPKRFVFECLRSCFFCVKSRLCVLKRKSLATPPPPPKFQFDKNSIKKETSSLLTYFTWANKILSTTPFQEFTIKSIFFILIQKYFRKKKKSKSQNDFRGNSSNKIFFS